MRAPKSSITPDSAHDPAASPTHGKGEAKAHARGRRPAAGFEASGVTTRGVFARFLAALLVPLVFLPLAGCAKALNAVTSKSGYRVERDLRYGPGDRAMFDLYVPDAATPSSPVVVFVHGGSWDSGDKDMYLFVGQSLAANGVIVAIPDYGLYPKVRFPGFVEDAARATARVAAGARDGLWQVPAGRHPIFLMGHSAGAEIAGLLATDGRWLARNGFSKEKLAGFVGLAGPYDFLPLTEERYKRIFPAKLRDESQPINFVDGHEPPMLLVAGSADTTVDPKNTRSLARKVREKGGTVEERIVPGVDHIGAITALATALPLSDASIRREVLDFIRNHSRR